MAQWQMLQWFMYCATRGTAADRVKVLVLDHGDQQRKFANGARGGANIYTLNLVDTSLLRDDEEAHSEQVSDAASGMQLADGDGSGTAAALVPTNPLMADEWATFESSGPASSNPGVSGVTLPVLDEQHFSS